VRTRFGGATAAAVAFAIYAVASIGGGVALGGPADLDPGFGTNGLATKVVPVVGTRSAFAIDAAIQNDNKYVVLGQGDGDFKVVRFNANGTVDAGFGSGGIATADFGGASGGDITAAGIAVDASQKIVVAGTKNDLNFDNESDDFAVARFDANGILDPTFDGDGKLSTDIAPTGDSSNDEAGDVVVLPDTTILVGGGSYVTGQERIAFARYLANGNPDTTFSTDGQSIANTPNHAIVERMVVDTGASRITAALGESRIFSGVGSDNFGVGRFFLDATGPEGGDANDGKFVTSGFGTNGLTDIDFATDLDGSTSIAVQGDSKIVVAGGTSVDSSGGSNSDFALARLDSGGALDASFGNGGKVLTSFGTGGFRGSIANDVAIQPGGKIVAAGSTDVCDFDPSFAVARYNTDGTLDPTFSGDGKSITGPDTGRGRAVLLPTSGPGSGKLVVAGTSFFPSEFALAQYGDGLPDTNPGFCPTSLTVHVVGPGTVDGDGINCPGDCVEASDPGNTFDFLTATPASGSTFAGWTGDCDQPIDPPEECAINIGTDTHVTATFAAAGTTTTTTTTTPTTTTTTPTTTTPAVDTDPPETTITKGPKKKTTKAKAKFALGSDEPGSTFECALTGKKVKKKLKKFKPCAAAPKYTKLKPGKKQFQTRATDLAGNLDPTPAVLKWTVKPKK
jgi:uncharacterized delta-60 repeat protein